MSSASAPRAEHYLRFCETQRGLSGHTIKNYSFDLAFFIKFLKENGHPLECNAVNRYMLESYLESMTSKYKVKTVRRKLACIRSFYAYLEDRELIENNPFCKFRLKLKEGYRKPMSMSMIEMDRFFKVAYDNELSEKVEPLIEKIQTKSIGQLDSIPLEFTWCRDLAIMELLFATGLRVSELCGLKFEDYNHQQHSLRIIGKGDRERFVYIEPQQTKKMFSDYLVLRNATGINLPNIFVTKMRAPMRPQGVRNIITKYAKLSGLNKNITPHVFRHSFATLLIESGVDIKYIQDLLGHSTIATTQIYLHISEDQKKKVLASRHPRDRICSANKIVCNI